MKFLPLALSSITVLICATMAFSQTPVPDEKEISGQWYMGTASGKDCYLELTTDHILRLLEGGCFHRDGAITSSWHLEGEKITIDSQAVKQKLGTYLLVSRYKNNIVLVREQKLDQVKKHGYVHYFCFWKNLMDNGLKLPADADAVREKYLQNKR